MTGRNTNHHATANLGTAAAQASSLELVFWAYRYSRVVIHRRRQGIGRHARRSHRVVSKHRKHQDVAIHRRVRPLALIPYAS